jgi:8-oxo-dGTP pyrophosphatase MutT (NUDIX family)
MTPPKPSAQPEPGATEAQLTIAAIRDRIRRHRYRPITEDERAIRHAVLVPLYLLGGVAHVVLTKRTNLVRMQKGHVSFPGGRREAGDPDLLATALRESAEEIGLEPVHVEVFGRIDDFSTRDGAVLIAGFAGLIDPQVSPYPWRPQESEVAEVLEVPIAHLLAAESWEIDEPRELNGRMWPNETLLFRGHRVFGATARALRHVLDIVTAKA